MSIRKYRLSANPNNLLGKTKNMLEKDRTHSLAFFVA